MRDEQGQMADELSEHLETHILHSFPCNARVSKVVFQIDEPKDSPTASSLMPIWRKASQF